MPLRSVLSLALACLVLAGCTPSTGQVERGLEKRLPEWIGPAEHYDVEIEGLEARRGEADRVVIVGERVRPDGAPAVERLDLDLLGVRFDRKEKRLERVDSARATVRITAPALGDFLETHENVRTASVVFEAPRRARLRLRPELGGFALPPGVDVEVEGAFVVEGGVLRFEIDDVEAAGLGLGGGLTRRLSDLVNPLVDLAGPPLRLRVESARIEDGRLRLDATGDPSGFRVSGDRDPWR